MLDFNNSTNTHHYQMVGRKDGTNAIKLGEGWVEEQMDLYRDTTSLQKEYSTFGDFITHKIGKVTADIESKETNDLKKNEPKSTKNSIQDEFIQK